MFSRKKNRFDSKRESDKKGNSAEGKEGQEGSNPIQNDAEKGRKSTPAEQEAEKGKTPHNEKEEGENTTLNAEEFEGTVAKEAKEEQEESIPVRSHAEKGREPTPAELEAEKGKIPADQKEEGADTTFSAEEYEGTVAKETKEEPEEPIPVRSHAEKGRKPTPAELEAEKEQAAPQPQGGKDEDILKAEGKSTSETPQTEEEPIPVRSHAEKGRKPTPAELEAEQRERSVAAVQTAETGSMDTKNQLNGISDIRRWFHTNEEPLYFISATNFNLLGADEWIKGFKFICHIECFDGLHPNVFSPKKEIPHDDFEGIEDINNYLLQHPEVQDYLKTRSVDGRTGKAMFLMFNEKTEELAEKLGLEIMFPSAEMRTFLDNKVNTNRIAEKAGVACVPYVLSQVRDYEHLTDIAKDLGSELVIQTPFGDSGHTTFFISNEEEFNKHGQEIIEEDEVKIMKRIRCRGSAIEACVTRHGTIVAPLMTELVGFKDLTPYEGGWCGNEIYPNAFSPELREKAIKYTQLFGNQLRKEGYKGYFELDFLIDQDNGEIYLGELNPRVTGASSITNHAVFALADAPLFVFHILEWMGVEYDLDVDALNKRWANQDNIDGWSQLIVKHTEDTIEYVTDSPKSGIWRMYDTGHIQFDRMDTHRRAVENEKEAFFLRITKKGDYLYEGADMGILVTRGRMMTDDFKLNHRAKHWIKAIRSQFKSEMVEDKKKPKLSGSLTK